MTPGYKTTEFWLSTVAVFAGLLVSSGAFAETSTVGKVVALVVSGLSALGYTASRTALKTKE